jgi:creatinine amidohydrolase
MIAPTTQTPTAPQRSTLPPEATSELNAGIGREPASGRLGVLLLVVMAAMLVWGWNSWRPDSFMEPAATPLPIVSLPPLAEPLRSLWIEELSWTEIAQAQAAGYDTVLLATGGTEQNGPHLPTGKHNLIVRFTAHEIAVRQGRTLVAPVLAYVPEQPHVNFPGTISLPNEVFQSVIEATAQSFLTQGFKDVILLGDSGGNQAPLRAAADSLRWRCSSGQRVLFLDQYYAGHGQTDWLLAQGFSAESLGSHAGVADTAELMAIDPSAVRNFAGMPGGDWGHDGQPNLATAALGQVLLELKITAAVEQLQRELPR